MINRPIVYFELTGKGWSEYFNGRLRKAGVIKSDPHSRKPTDPQDYVSVLFIPDRFSPEYRIFATRDRKISIQVRTREDVFRNQMLGGLRHFRLGRWVEVDRSRSGLFFSEGKERVLLSASTGDRLYYRPAGQESPSYFEMMGPLNMVVLIKTGLILGVEEFVTMKRTVDSLMNPYPWSKFSTAPISRAKPVALEPVVNAQTLTWEVLPPGWWRFHRTVGKNRKRYKTLSADELQRIEFINTLGKPIWYSGSHLGERVYFVALFGDLAVADCPEFGNALYYFKGDNWQEVFRQSKREALDHGASRIVHSGYWQTRIRELIESELVTV